MMKGILAVAAAALLAGCTHVSQTVSPVAKGPDKEICVIENPAVKAEFLPAFRRALESKGFTVKQLSKDATPKDCPLTATYTADWRWDILLYMEIAEINVFRDGAPAGKAVHDSRNAGLNFGKYVGAENKIRELVDKLFP
jgi:hypothetical protein